MSFEQVKQQEQANMMHTYGRFPVALVKGKGVTAWDTEGKDYIDFTSGIGVNALGWCDEGWVQAVSHQAGELQHISNLYYNPVQTKLAKPPAFPKYFLATPAQRPTNALLNWRENGAWSSLRRKTGS